MKRWALLSLSLMALALVSGCSSSPKPAEQENPKPPELLTGRSAFQQLYIAAHGWAADARPYELQSQTVADSKGQNGVASLWRASFASQTGHSSKPYMWSGVDLPEGPSRGVSSGPQDTFMPGNAFDVNFLKVDSDKAYQVAEKHGGEKLADSPVVYLLDWNRGENNLVWHVIFGTSRNDAKLVIDVDATTGNFIRKEK
jgi:hypothetical protein